MKRLLLLGGLVLFTAAPAAQSGFDLVIRNARIVDGTGASWYRGDIAVRGDTIAQTGAAAEGSGDPRQGTG